MIDYASAVSTSGIFAPKRIHVLGVHYDGHEGESEHQIYDPSSRHMDYWYRFICPSLYDLGLVTIDDLLFAIGGGYESSISDETLMFTPIGYIPEFPSWIILPLFISSTLCVIIVRNKIRKKGLE